MQAKQEKKVTITTANSDPVAIIASGATGIGFLTGSTLNLQGCAGIITGVSSGTIAAAGRNLTQSVVVLHADLQLLQTFDFRVRKRNSSRAEESA